MQLHEVEKSVADLNVQQGFELIYDLLRSYGISNASITRLRSGSYDKAEYENEVLWKDKVFYRFVDNGDDLHNVIDEARHDESILRHRPRFLIVRDDKRILAVDTRTNDTLDTRLSELSGYSAFFLPWAGIEKTQIESAHFADLKAAEKMARLYDEIVAHNRVETATDIHRLNIFFSRLLFCFFAEDTGVFVDGAFTNGIASLTAEDGSDTARYLDSLFKVLDLEPHRRKGIPSHFADFGYVNGKLFAAQAASPAFSAKARRLILECGTLNWSVINPDIFGSMMQAVVHRGQRESLGMHYTSVDNIMKVIRPLFLDDVLQAYDRANTKAKLERLLKRISEITFFDPACGSGNFLVIAYKELRKLEHRILKKIVELDPDAPRSLFELSCVKLENFFGIEIDDFAHEIAVLSLWLAKHQMNVEFRELFGVEISLIPLKDTGNIICANAARIDWAETCPSTEESEIYLLGNPPYLGARLQSVDQKSDLQSLTGVGEISNNLDYVAIWFLLGAKYVASNGGALGFVSTNSICQGDQVAMLWPNIYELGVDIAFGVQSFKWSNNAKGNAGVACVVIGLMREGDYVRRLYNGSHEQMVELISPYLTRTRRRVIVEKQPTPLSTSLPPLSFGSMSNDGGHLILQPMECDALLAKSPEAGNFIRRFVGAEEFLNGSDRYALWISVDNVNEARRIPDIARRIQCVSAYRLASKRLATRKLADVPYRFGEIRHRDTPAIIVPRHSSESREYIPMGYLDARTVISDAANAIYDAEPWVLAMISSRIHNVWVRAVSGTLESRIRYSATLSYNTFPLPDLSKAAKTTLQVHTFAVLEAREHHSDVTMAQMYELDRMPADLRSAHQELDETVDHLYRKRPFGSDDDRLELLLGMYEAAVAGAEFQHELELVADA